MSDWSGQIKDSANARGVWMRADSLIEHIPSFPGDIDELDAPSEADFSETEVTDTANTPMRSRNRGPITDPPPPSRALAPIRRPKPAPLYDEPPDHSETTPPTWDMGLLPATYADAEVTEENDETSRPADLSTFARSAASLARSAAIAADQEASIEIELLDDWMEQVDQLDIDAPRQQLFPVPTDPRAPGGRAPLSSRTGSANPIVSRGTGSANPIQSYVRPVVSRGTGTARPPVPRPAAPRPPAPRPAAPGPDNRASATAPVAPARHASTPDRYAFDSHAITRPTARPPMVPYYEPDVPSAFERAGWWAAGALSGMIGASVLASLAFAAALLV
ncbi:MAG: hypothetical protein H6737_02210 [Alphaproteobacteria bacterium]|nr:hypothetical protein [Alphaproteobacteria bacterium]